MARERILWTRLGRITLSLLHILLAVKIYPRPLGSNVATGRLGTLCPEGCGGDLGEQVFVSVRRRLPLVICWDLYRFELLFHTGSTSLSHIVVRTEKK